MQETCCGHVNDLTAVLLSLVSLLCFFRFLCILDNLLLSTSLVSRASSHSLVFPSSSSSSPLFALYNRMSDLAHSCGLLCSPRTLASFHPGPAFESIEIETAKRRENEIYHQLFIRIVCECVCECLPVSQSEVFSFSPSLVLPASTGRMGKVRSIRHNSVVHVCAAR